MPELLWEPDQAGVEHTQIAEFARFVSERRGVAVADYGALWTWSVEQLGEFWQAVWDYFEISSDTDPGPALENAEMPGARWFPQARSISPRWTCRS